MTRALLVTGASGFVGRHLVDRLKESYRVFCIARRSQAQCGAPVHPNITWFQVDITHPNHLAEAFDLISAAGPLVAVFHLAAHYDFTGEKSELYWRTNVEGLRNVLEQCRRADPEIFVFASSLAACRFPPPGKRVQEDDPAQGTHIYAVTKRLGEEMIRSYGGNFKCCTVRFAALFSDWCEYPPLYSLMTSWVSKSPFRRVVAGRGHTALPYLHVKEAVSMLLLLMKKREEVEHGEVFHCAVDGCVTHRELFELVNLYWSGERPRPILVPKWACYLGLVALGALGKLAGREPFEKPWMVAYIDKKLDVSSKKTRAKLGWTPRARYDIRRRIPFMVEHLRSDPLTWHAKNRAALRKATMTPRLAVCRTLDRARSKIMERWIEELLDPAKTRLYPRLSRLGRAQMEWMFQYAFTCMVNAIRTGDKGIFMAHCRTVAAQRHAQGVSQKEVCNAYEALARACFQELIGKTGDNQLEELLYEQITTTMQFGCDQLADTYEELEEAGGTTVSPPTPELADTPGHEQS